MHPRASSIRTPVEMMNLALIHHRAPDEHPELRTMGWSRPGCIARSCHNEPTLTGPDASLNDLARAVAVDRDQRAFRTLYRHYVPRLRAFLARRGTDGAMLDEVIQEVMLTLWHKADQFDPKRASLTTWVYRIARNRHIDRVRSESRPELNPDDPALVPPTSPLPDDQVALGERLGVLREALPALPPEQASVLRQQYFEDKTMAAIAAESGVPVGTVKTRARLALKFLRDRLRRTRPEELE